METNYNDNELEQMRRQLGILKEKLSKQEIVNERLIRESMKKRMSWVNWMVIIEIISAPLLIALYWGLLESYKYSYLFIAYILLIDAVDIYADYKINHIKSSDWAEAELLTLSRRLVRMKRLRNIQAVVGAVAAIILFAWILVIGIGSAPEAHRIEYTAIGLFLGVLALGLVFVVCIIILNIMNSSNDRLIREINEMTADDETHP